MIDSLGGRFPVRRLAMPQALLINAYSPNDDYRRSSSARRFPLPVMMMRKMSQRPFIWVLRRTIVVRNVPCLDPGFNRQVKWPRPPLAVPGPRPLLEPPRRQRCHRFCLTRVLLDRMSWERASELELDVRSAVRAWSYEPHTVAATSTDARDSHSAVGPEDRVIWLAERSCPEGHSCMCKSDSYACAPPLRVRHCLLLIET